MIRTSGPKLPWGGPPPYPGQAKWYHRRESARHPEYRGWLEERLSGMEPFGVSELALSAFVRLVTNHRIYREPTSPEAAIDFCEIVLSAPATVPVRPGPRHWSLFAGLCRDLRARANLVPDAYLAALALEQGATWFTVDRGFSRFPGLRSEAVLPPAGSV